MIYFRRAGSDYIWHVGEPLPAIATQARVLELRADGDELAIILAALCPGGIASAAAAAFPGTGRIACPACHAYPCKCERLAATELPIKMGSVTKLRVCKHVRLNEDGICRECGSDQRS